MPMFRLTHRINEYELKKREKNALFTSYSFMRWVIKVLSPKTEVREKKKMKPANECLWKVLTGEKKKDDP